MDSVVDAAAASAWRWWRRAGWPSRGIAALGVVGLVFVGLSLLPGSGMDAAWLRDFLMTVGASLALFAPFYLITRSLDQHLDRVATDTVERVEEVRTDTAQKVEKIRRENTASTTNLTEQVEALRLDVDRRLGDLNERVTSRLAAEAAADRAAFASLRTTPTWDAFWEAFGRARQLGLVSGQRPPRVNISKHSWLYVSVEADWADSAEWADETLQLRVETLSGRLKERIQWSEDRDVEEILVEIGRLLSKHTGEQFDTASFVNGVADLLEASLSHPERRPAIELCPPQWMVCDWGVITYDSHHYGVKLRQLQTSATVAGHVAEKRWVDPDSWDNAREAALALYPTPPNANESRDALPADEPPF
ncbi:MAG: hypothetical protein ACRCYU_06775 [Nocardioides sp.]